MKKLLLLASGLFVIANVQAQCPTNYDFSTQQMVDAFKVNYPNCRDYSGYVVIFNNTSVQNLNGLSNLESTVGLGFSNTQISDFTGLSNLKSISSGFGVEDNIHLVNLSFLSNLTVLHGLNLYNVPNLTNISALSGVTSSFNNLTIEGTKLSSLDGLQNIPSIIGGDIRIGTNPKLSDIASLENTKFLPNSSTFMGIYNNPLLSSCAITPICENMDNFFEFFLDGNGPNCTLYNDLKAICQGALPVSLHEFQAAKGTEGILLKWSTTEESDSKEFEIHRSSNGKKWIGIGKIDAAVESNSTRSYQFTDHKPILKNNYYRLKMIDQDQSFSYSGVAHSYFYDLEEPFLFPNPATDYLNVSNLDWSSFEVYEILNSGGETVLNSKNVPNSEIDIRSVQSGSYLLKIRRLDRSERVHKFMVNAANKK